MALLRQRAQLGRLPDQRDAVEVVAPERLLVDPAEQHRSEGDKSGSESHNRRAVSGGYNTNDEEDRIVQLLTTGKAEKLNFKTSKAATGIIIYHRKQRTGMLLHQQNMPLAASEKNICACALLN